MTGLKHVLVLCLLASLVVLGNCAQLPSSFADDLLERSIYIRMETHNETARNIHTIRQHYETLGWKRIHNQDEQTIKTTSETINSQMVHVTFALKNQNVDLLMKKALSVSDPSHPDHENFLTMDQLAEYTKPSPQNKEMVLHYIRTIPGAIVLDVSKHENFITCLLPVQSINKYFKADMKPHMHQSTGTVLLRSMEQGYSLPSEIAQAVSLVSGLIRFPTMKSFVKSSVAARDNQDIAITPQVIWKRYNLTQSDSVSSQSSQAVASFLQQYFSSSDLQAFQSTYNLVQQSPSVLGPNDQSNPGVEASLDIQYLMGVGYKINTVFVSTPGLSNVTGQEPFVDWAIKVGFFMISH